MTTAIHAIGVTRFFFPPVTAKLCRVMRPTLYRYIWGATRAQQIRLCILSTMLFPLAMLPLEIQRRVIDDALRNQNLRLLALLGIAYLAVVLLQGGLKFAVNVYKGMVAEGIVRILRLRISGDEQDIGDGARVSMFAAEAEPLGGFAAESIATPILQTGILVSILGYMVWIAPTIAAFAIALFVPIVLVVPRVQAAINRHSKIRTTLLRRLSDQLTQKEGGGAAASPTQDAAFNRRINRIYQTRLRIFVLKHGLKLFNNLIGHLGVLGVLMVGGVFFIAGEATLGTVVAFIAGFQRLTEPARDLLNFFRQYSNTRVLFGLLRQRMS